MNLTNGTKNSSRSQSRGTVYFVQQLAAICPLNLAWNKHDRVNGFKERTQSTATFLFVLKVSPALFVPSPVCNSVYKLLNPTGLAEGQFRKIIGLEHLEQDTARLHCTDPRLVLLSAWFISTSHTARFPTRRYSSATILIYPPAMLFDPTQPTELQSYVVKYLTSRCCSRDLTN
jgi:hypothetical protein